MTIFMIGHSNISLNQFVANLERHKVAHLYDVRSIPRSRWPHFNGPTLKRSLQAKAIAYHHVPLLGGKPVSPRSTIQNVLTTLLAQHEEWKSVPCLMCSEGNPNDCHRRWDLEPVVKMLGHEVEQILRDGTLERAPLFQQERSA